MRLHTFADEYISGRRKPRDTSGAPRNLAVGTKARAIWKLDASTDIVHEPHALIFRTCTAVPTSIHDGSGTLQCTVVYSAANAGRSKETLARYKHANAASWNIFNLKTEIIGQQQVK